MFVPLACGAVALAITMAFLTACGGDSVEPEATATSAETSSDSAAPAGDTESITATEADFTISLDEDSLSPGSYEITVNNEGDATHDLVVERDGEDVAGTEEIQP